MIGWFRPLGARPRSRVRRLLVAGLLFALLFVSIGPAARAANFRRGDSNADGHLDLSDAVHILFYLFTGGVTPGCLKASDSDDSGVIDLSDAVYTLQFLFLGGKAIPAPGPSSCGDDPTADGLTCAAYAPCGSDPALLQRVGHLLNRAAYGPTFSEVERVLAMGTDAWIAEQLDPPMEDDPSLAPKIAPLTEQLVRAKDIALVRPGEVWTYWKGTTAPPAAWKTLAFDDSAWLAGPSGFGYGDNDDATVLDDMVNNYMAVFIRKKFAVADPAALHSFVLSVNYDDGFVAYLNGTEVARKNIAGAVGSAVAFNAAATAGHEAGEFEDIDITSKKGLLVAGTNVLTIEVHNQTLASGDLSMIPELLDREVLPGGTTTEIKGVTELKALLNVHAVYSPWQLQSVLGEFWENHLTTDYDKVADYFDNLSNSDASKAMSTAQARKEAARLEHREYEYFRKHALGNFGDLLRYSATSPTMLIYLDNVLNIRGNANENYAREIMELSSLGVSNGQSPYTQTTVEQLAKCFTGWGVAKVALADASNPNTPNYGVKVNDSLLFAPGAFNATTNPTGGNWRYMKGTAEPPPEWKNPGFDDSGWLSGPTGIGYGDNDDATPLPDMINNYTTIYLRRTFTVADPSALKNLILRVDVDDGFVAYLNGTEVARYYAAGGAGSIVPHDAIATQGHEAGNPLEYNMNQRRNLLVAGANTIAFQVLNSAKDSSDLTIIPSLVDREILPGSIENGDPDAVWAFHFFPALHNTADTKTLFENFPTLKLVVPANRMGSAGIQDAYDGIDRILVHPSTANYICSKLIQRFVGDQIDFRDPAAGPYATLLARCITAWNSTNPKGDIAKVMETILKSDEFWSDTARRSKVKSGIEYLASTVRVLGAQTNGIAPIADLTAMGMDFFTRDEPDGWPEVGTELMDTGGLLARMQFAQKVTEGTQATSPGLYWDALPYLAAQGLDTADKIVDFFNELLFAGTLTSEERSKVIEFLNTDDNYQPLPLSPGRSDFSDRIRRGLGLMLSLPEWEFQ